jgi:hypothetical protein
LQLLLRLEATYDVTRSEEFPPSDVFLSPGALEELKAASVLPPVLLTPRLATAAPLAVAFTTPPGLVVRCGRWCEARFGAAFCLGYEAWASAATEAVRLDDLLGKVVDGLFREEVRLPPVGDARVYAAVGDETSRGGLNGESWSTISRDRARILIGAGPHAVRWHAWPRCGR